MARTSPAADLERFMARYDPNVVAVAKAALARMRKRLPGAVQLVYDNGNALVIGFGPTERASEAVFSLALYPRWVNLFFLHGATLDDPQGLLKGGGKQVRSVRLDDPAGIDAAGVRALMDQALEQAGVRLDGPRRGALVIRAVSAAKRPRRPQGRSRAEARRERPQARRPGATS